jgi:phosphatidylethanolamine/phosphatidyl-N-methylethanolamine N-methyltransferase
VRLTNRSNRIVYRLWSPVYDALLARLFQEGRRRAMAVAALEPAERVLLVGVGTGADLPLLPAGVGALGVDLSEAMLRRARARLPLAVRDILLQVGDAQALPVRDRAFDVALLNLILSVVPEPRRCLGEALRALRPGGRLVVFDKFLPDGARPTLGRRLANQGATLLGTDLNRRLGDMTAGLPCQVVRDEPSILGGRYRVLLLRKT